MFIYYVIISFIFGTILGSFYNVVAYRLPKGESIIYPSSHCPNCNHKLGPSELIPIFSFLFQKGKCKNCKQKISWFYTIFEFITGVLFSLCFIKFHDSNMFFVNLVFISTLIIVFISDYQTMIIPDEVIITSTILISILLLIFSGYKVLLNSLLNALLSFAFMFLLKKLGDFLFKKESMGGGDKKLLFVFGVVLGLEKAIISIFLGAIIALPISLIQLKKDSNHIIPFGPFLSIAALILLFVKFSLFNTL